jgi:membrane protein YdbS with pleckstrin-like domain
MAKENHRFNKPRNVRRMLWWLVAVCGLLFAADFIYHRHIVHPWEELWGFYAIYGFVSCVVLVLVAKQMRKLLMRDEEYYERDD